MCRLRAPALRALSVDSLEAKSSCAVTALAAAFPGLAALHVLHSHKVSTSALAALVTLLPRLQELHLDDTLTLPAAAWASLPSCACQSTRLRIRRMR